MKSICLFLLMLFIATGCNANKKNSQENMQKQETDLFSEVNDKYSGKYIFNSEKEETFGNVSIYSKTDNTISFELYIEMRGNSGEISGEMEIENGKGVFKSTDDGDCILEFVFTNNSVKISHQEGGYGCGFGMNVAVNNTFLKKSTETSSLPAGKITEDMLWEIFMKIPEDNIPEYRICSTIQQRRQAKANKLFKIQSEEYDNTEECDNHLLYDETNNDGIRYFMGIIGYPTNDGKKIIALFYFGGGVDIYSTESKQTYEYDIAAGNLKAIECPMDPYTENEFFDESTLTPKQVSEMRKLFSEKSLFNYVNIDKAGFSLYFAAFDAFDDNWEKYGEYIGNNQVRRNWDGKCFVKAEK